jgi:hypothetical protein
MTAKDAIQSALQSTHSMLGMYVNDLSDADLLVRPVPNANHIAWQLGHLIGTECQLGAVIPGAKYPELPAGWAQQHSKTTASMEPPKGFATKAEYLDKFKQAREATIAALKNLNDADLDKPTTSDMAKYAPTLAALFLLNANHVMMHAGQFTVVRRKLGKPILF